MLKRHSETRTMTKGMKRLLLTRPPNQQRITKETTASRNKDSLRRPPPHQHRRPRPQRQVGPRRALRTAFCTAHRWACKNSTPPTSCWRRCRAPWSFCPSRCSSWRRPSRSLCVTRCSSSGRRCRFSETSRAQPSRSCTTNWTGGRRYSGAVSDGDAGLYFTDCIQSAYMCRNL